MNRSPFSIYCDWGLHDELGDTVELTADMTSRALDHLTRWREKHGVGFDYYLIDCFWFDPQRGYKHFKKPHWPAGFEPLLERIRGLGMIPGLWYSTSGWRLDVPEWADSRSTNTHYSLVDGPYAKHLEESLFHAADKWGVRFFKFDFAQFTTSATGVTRPPEETYRQSVDVLTGILQRLRRAYPDLYSIAHCGYNRARYSPAGAHSPANDTSWLRAFNAMFSGDPIPSMQPRSSLGRSCDLFQDEMVYMVHRDGFPLDRIEDHGVMVGNTNTCLERGRTGFRRSHLAQLARGGRRDFYYGDPSLLTDDDLAGLRKSRSLFYKAWNDGLATQFVGPGRPGGSPWHGFLTGGGAAGLLYLTNGTCSPQKISLTMPGLFTARSLFRDAAEHPAVFVTPDRLTVELAPESVALIGCGEYADASCDLGSGDDLAPKQMSLLPLQFKTAPGLLSASIDSPLPAGTQLHVVVDFRDATMLESRPMRLGNQDNLKRKHDTLRVHELAGIRIIGKRGPIEHCSQVPDTAVFSGIAWVARTFNLSAADLPATLEVVTQLPEGCAANLRAYAIRRDA
jgi:hypothetical protein